jgi:hypothetical protein
MTESERNLDALEESFIQQANETVSKKDLDREARRRKRTGQVVVALSLLISLLSLLVGQLNSQALSDAAAAQSLNTASIDALREANAKLEARGLPPIPVPQPGSEIDVNALAQAAAALALADIKTDPEFRGPRGEAGLPGLPCLPEIAGCSGPMGPAGQPGKDGENGTDGAPGQNGLDGQNGAPGVPCDPAVNPLCQGPAGPVGPGGQPGQGFDPDKPPHFEGNADECELVMDFINPSAQTRTAVSGVLCIPA